MYEKQNNMNVKVEPRSTSRSSSTVHILPLFFEVIKIYVRAHLREIYATVEILP